MLQTTVHSVLKPIATLSSNCTFLVAYHVEYVMAVRCICKHLRDLQLLQCHRSPLTVSIPLLQVFHTCKLFQGCATVLALVSRAGFNRVVNLLNMVAA